MRKMGSSGRPERSGRQCRCPQCLHDGEPTPTSECRRAPRDGAELDIADFGRRSEGSPAFVRGAGQDLAEAERRRAPPRPLRCAALLATAAKGLLSPARAATPSQAQEHLASPRCHSPPPTPHWSTRPGSCSARGTRSVPEHPTPAAQAPCPRRLRGRCAAHLRAHRGGRGTGPLAHAATDGGAPVTLGLGDRGGRHRPGHGPLGGGQLGRRDDSPPTPAARPAWWSCRSATGRPPR